MNMKVAGIVNSRTRKARTLAENARGTRKIGAMNLARNARERVEIIATTQRTQTLRTMTHRAVTVKQIELTTHCRIVRSK